MTTAVQHRRGTTAEHATFTGLEGEVTIDTTKDTAVIHDGTLAGGYPLAKENLANVNPTTLSTIDGASTASDDKFLIWDQSALTLKSITRAELNNAMEADALASVTITGGTINGTTIGGTTPAAITGTTITATAFSGPIDGTVGATTPAAGAFTTLTASSTATLNTLASSGATLTGGSINNMAIGGSTAAAGAFTTLAASGAVTLSGGTANGVAYLNGSKVLTTGSALTFDGTNLGVGISTATAPSTIRTNGSYLTQDIVGDATNGWASMRYRNAANSATTVFFNYDNGAYKFGTVANEPIVFNVNNSEAMRLTSTGLGIGTSSPGEKLNVVGGGSTSSTVNFTGGSNNDNATIASDYSLNFQVDANNNVGGREFNWRYGGKGYSDGTLLMTLNSSGNLGLGVTPSASTLKMLQGPADFVIGTQANGLYLANSAYYNGGWKYASGSAPSRFTQDNGAFQWHTAPSGTAGNAISFTQAATLTADGNFLVGTTSTTGRITSVIGDGTAGSFTNSSASASYTLAVNNNAASGTRRYVNFAISGTSTGEIYSTGTVTVYGTTSDYRLKTVIGVLSGAGARIDALEPIEYEWKSSGERTRGFLAHKFQEIYPQSVSGQKDAIDSKGKPVYQSMQAASAEVIADIVAEIQSLRQRVAQLEQA